MMCDKCDNKPKIRGLTDLLCPVCAERKLVMIGCTICFECSNDNHICQICNVILDTEDNIEYNI